MATIELSRKLDIPAEATTRTKFLVQVERHYDYKRKTALDSRIASSSDPYLVTLNLARSTVIHLYNGSKRWVLQKLFRGYATFGQIAERFLHDR